MRALTHRLRSEEHGVVLVMVAILLPVFIGLTALAVDVGSFYQAQSQAQQAADAGALAGADVLVSAPTTVTTTASNMATSNDANVTPTVSLPGSNQVKVVVTGTSPAFFGRFLGLTNAKVGATAVATAGTVASAPISIYANSQTACSSNAFHFDGSNDSFGSIQTNGTGFFDVGPDAFGAFLYGHGCSAPTFNGSSTSDTFTSGPSPAPATQTFPQPFTTSDFTCDTTLTGNQDFSGPVSGTYCDLSGVISFSGAVNGKATFIANQFNANSITGNITPAQNGVTLYETGSSDLHVQDAGYFNGGIIYAPLAAVTIQNFSGSITGIVEADSVTVSASNLTWTGISTTTGGGPSALSQ